MMILPPTIAATGYGILLTVLAPLAAETPSAGAAEPVPILEVIKVYGKLAGPTCFGKTAPKGSSCQVTRQEFDRIFGNNNSQNEPSRSEFATQLGQLNFEWPLKPYGVEKSEDKTAIMNKGAETAIYMNQLEARGLYDRRNPTGPLPTSLRPQLNRQLQAEGVSDGTLDFVFGRLAAAHQGSFSDALFQGRETIDYYDFLEFLGKTSITWN